MLNLSPGVSFNVSGATVLPPPHCHYGQGLPQGYHSGMNILLVGEGNLSFALALVTLFEGEGANILATSLDRQCVARAAYPARTVRSTQHHVTSSPHSRVISRRLPSSVHHLYLVCLCLSSPPANTG